MLRRPVNDPILNSFTSLDWSYYGAQVGADEEEEAEKLRDLAEYQAMFSNPDGVRKVRTMRAQREMEGSLEPGRTSATTDDEQFAKFISADGSKVPKFRPRY